MYCIGDEPSIDEVLNMSSFSIDSESPLPIGERSSSPICLGSKSRVSLKYII